MTPALVDNTVLSNFAHVGRPELLQKAFGALSIVPSVLAELRAGERMGRVPVVNWDWLSVVELSPDEKALAGQVGQALGAGEAETLSVAQVRGWAVLTDDRDARRVSESLGVSVSGTLGAFVKLVGEGILTLEQGDELLNEMTEHGYYSPVKSLAELGL